MFMPNIPLSNFARTSGKDVMDSHEYAGNTAIAILAPPTNHAQIAIRRAANIDVKIVSLSPRNLQGMFQVVPSRGTDMECLGFRLSRSSLPSLRDGRSGTSQHNRLGYRTLF